MSLSFLVSLHLPQENGLKNLEQGLDDNGTEYKFSVTQTQSIMGNKSSLSRPSVWWTESTVLQEVILKTLKMTPSHQGSQKLTRDPPSLSSISGHHWPPDNMALAMVTTLAASTESKRGVVLINTWISNMKFPGSILCLNFICIWIASMWFQLMTCTLRRV